MNKMDKQKYAPPVIGVANFHMESTIAAGSANVKPATPSSVEAEWETEEDINRTFNWDWE